MSLLHNCDQCPFTAVAIFAMIHHLRNTHGVEKCPLKCKRCHETFWCKSQLKRHTARDHLKLKIQFTVQPELISQRETSMALLKPKAKRTIYECDQCDRKYKEKALLEVHARQHTGERPFQCTTCGKNFISKIVLKNHHVNVHSGEKAAAICEICGKSFASKAYLWQHQRTHLPVTKQMHCGICDFVTHSRTSIVRHVESHLLPQERKYTCNMCGRGFTSRGNLRSHEVLHSEKQEHVCNVCNKKYSSQFGLNRHMKLHVGLKKFVCHLCDSAHYQKCGLRTHQWTVHKILPYECDMCDDGFKLKTELKKHKFYKHFEMATYSV